MSNNINTDKPADTIIEAFRAYLLTQELTTSVDALNNLGTEDQEALSLWLKTNLPEFNNMTKESLVCKAQSYLDSLKPSDEHPAPIR